MTITAEPTTTTETTDCPVWCNTRHLAEPIPDWPLHEIRGGLFFSLGGNGYGVAVTVSQNAEAEQPTVYADAMYEDGTKARRGAAPPTRL